MIAVECVVCKDSEVGPWAVQRMFGLVWFVCEVCERKFRNAVA